MKKLCIILICCFLFFISSAQESNEQEIEKTVEEVSKDISNPNRVFTDIEDEYKLAKYFFNSKDRKIYKLLPHEEKPVFLERFWAENDPNPVTSQNEFLQVIIERIKYCNEHFSHFKDGWKTDRGRIFIKYGTPFEILNEVTGRDTKATEREYQIWKYRIGRNMTYIFIDLQHFGDYRIIYSQNDEKEITLPDWRSYLGSDFDASILY